MRRDDAVRLLRAHADEIRARGVRKLALFGSTARDDADPESDVDVVIDVDPDEKFSLIDLASLRVYLRDLLDRETDVVVRDDLRPRFRGGIITEAVEVF